MKRALLSLLLCLCVFVLRAQQEEYREQFDRFRRQAQERQQTFVDENNRRYVEFLKSSWQKFHMKQPVEPPARPEPVQPVAYDPASTPDLPTRLEVEELVCIPVPLLEFAPLPLSQEPLPAPQPVADGTSFAFYGTSLCLRGWQAGGFRLSGTTEREVAAGWEALCRTDYGELLEACGELRARLRLNDFGYLLLLRELTKTLFAGRPNEQAVAQAFLLTQSGFKARIMRQRNRLGVLVAADCRLYGVGYWQLAGEAFYNLLCPDMRGEVETYGTDGGLALRPVSMYLEQTPLLHGGVVERTLQSDGYPLPVRAEVSENLVRFYKDYPQCDFAVYARSGLSDEFRRTLLPALQEAVRGKGETEAANLLLNFVQTAFDYRTDAEQFGYEKPLFAEETLYYPYSDCEDRAILFQHLVKSLLRLDVVLVDYPDHIATAVRFRQPVEGDHFLIDGAKYLVCDPTYIHAGIGMAMPQYKGVKATILR